MRLIHLTAGLVSVLVLAGACLAGDPVVSNIRASQREGSKLVDIYYDVADSDGDRLSVKVAATTNGVALPVASLSGDVGAGVAPGKGKHIVWNAGADWPGKFSASVRVAVAADDGKTPDGMVAIPGGTNSGVDPKEGFYALTVSAFNMDRTEVTKAKWDEVSGWAAANGYDISSTDGSGKATNHPVYYVTWYECVKWCNARSEKEGRTPCYTISGQIYKTGLNVPDCNFEASGYRLPLSVEWEYAARGGMSGLRFPWGDTIDHSFANYLGDPTGYPYDFGYAGYDLVYATGGYPYTSPVGSFAANGYGLWDMAGNVFEWCWDAWGSNRILRSGSWNGGAGTVRCGRRDWNVSADSSTRYYGFRTVCH